MTTGEVHVRKIIAAHDIGRALNPLTLRGQIEGGVVMGVGYATREHLLVEDGRVTNPSFRDYKLLTAPEIDFEGVTEGVSRSTIRSGTGDYATVTGAWESTGDFAAGTTTMTGEVSKD